MTLLRQCFQNWIIFEQVLPEEILHFNFKRVRGLASIVHMLSEQATQSKHDEELLMLSVTHHGTVPSKQCSLVPRGNLGMRLLLDCTGSSL